MNGKICIVGGSGAALVGQGVCHFTLGINFLGQLLSIGGVALIGYGIICLPSVTCRWPRTSQILRRLSGSLLLALFVSFVCIQGLITVHSYSEDYDGDYLIVLGAGLYGTEPSASLVSRLEMAQAYLESHPQAIAVLSGGQGPGEDITEAEAMQRYLTARGISPKRLWLEKCSANTRENLYYSKALLAKHLDLRKTQLAIVTNDFHQYRAQSLAKQLELDTVALAAPVPAFPGLEFNCYLREYFAVVKFYLQSWGLL